MSFLNTKGTFVTGCNYWASHAGTAMWSDWQVDVVEADFQRLSAAGIKVIRVFPLWSDFQPIHQLRQYAGIPVEYRFGETPLPDDEAGSAGINLIAIAHFAEFACLAEKYNLTLIVGLITGWMSGRLFVPPALEGKNILTDPVAIQWEVRFIKYFVNRFKNCPVIAAWDLGNECNCLAEVPSSEAAWNWTSTITNAIKAADSSRPVISGMHSLLPEGKWTMQDQGEITDILTTHPYPLFTPYCALDPINTIRSELHAVAESLFYSGIGNKPCFAEETGTLGPMFAEDGIAGDYIRSTLFSLWSHDCRGFLWWCANEQSHLQNAPYDWNAVERELGFFRTDGTPKPVLNEISKFTQFVESFPYETLPQRMVDGVCILTKGQDTWGAAYSAFTLAVQAGLDIEYQYARQPIKDAKLYLLPSLNGDTCISRHRMNELLEKVKKGAVLYMSMDSGLLSPFSEYSGVKVLTREKTTRGESVIIKKPEGDISLYIWANYKLNLEAVDAQVLAVNEAGQPAFTCARYGEGKIFFLNYPLETHLTSRPGVFHEENAAPYFTIYQYLKDSITTDKIVTVDLPNVGVTEHCSSDSRRIAVLINYEPFPLNAKISIPQGWRISRCLYGENALQSSDSIYLNKNDAAVLELERVGI